MLPFAALITQDCHRLARIVIAVVAEKDNLTPEFRLQSARGFDLRIEKTSRKNPARLLPETNDRWRHTRTLAQAAHPCYERTKTVFSRTVASSRTATQPIRLYHRYPIFVL